MTKTKIIIIGAGMAGLGAAKTFHDNGFTDFIILEAQGKIGGRINAQPYGDSIVELGAQWLHRADNNLFELVKKNDCLHDKDSWEGEGEFVTSEGERIEQSKCKKFLDWFEWQLNEVDNYILEIGDEASAKMSLGGYFQKNFDKYVQSNPDDDLTDKQRVALFQWCNSFQRIDNSCHKMTDVSLRRWPQFEKNFPDLVWLYHNFKDGTQKTVEKISSSFLSRQQIFLNTPVIHINWEGGSSAIEVTCSDNSKFTCDSVLITCSIGVLKGEKDTLFSPPLPSNVLSSIDASGFGPLGKIYLEWDEPWWPKDCRGFQFLWTESIDCCGGEYETNRVEKNWIKAVTGFDPILNNPKVLLGWIGGPEAIYVENLDEEIIKKECSEALMKFTGCDVPQPKSVLVSKWNSNVYIRGAYSYCSVKADGMEKVGDPWDTLADPILNRGDLGLVKPAILFAGEGVSKLHYSTLHGAFGSGEEQAKKLLELYKRWWESREMSPDKRKGCK